MTPEKVLEEIVFYRERFAEMRISKKKLSDKDYDDTAGAVKSFRVGNLISVLSHCHAMLDEMEQFVKDDRMEKTFRWLGFIQGVLWAFDHFTINELKNHNRSDEDKSE